MRRIFFALCTLVLIEACAKKEKKEAFYSPAVLSADAVPDPNLNPTNPEGGEVLGKLPDMSQEEVFRRKSTNEQKPIVWGQGAAGIDLQTFRSKALTILAPRLGVSDPFDIYPEHLAVAWDTDADPIPGLIRVLDGYPGKLDLGPNYGLKSPGDVFSNVQLFNEGDLLNLTRKLAIVFEKQTDAYDCEAAFSCRFLILPDIYALEFQKGRLILSRELTPKLLAIDIWPAQKVFPRPRNPIVYNPASIAGIDFNSQRKAVEDRLGPSLGQASGNGVRYDVYDFESLFIQWGPDSRPLRIRAQGSYGGALDFGGAIGSRFLGDTFAEDTQLDTNGQKLLILIDQLLNNRAPGFDCTTQVDPCKLEASPLDGTLALIYPNALFIFSNDASRVWLAVEWIKTP